MSKHLVVCCDGTWNTPDQQKPTNVTKVALAVSQQAPSGREQRTFYHCGVGTRRWERIRGGGFGFGLSRDLRETYRVIVQNFDPGDQLYFFGFSRGAFTARSIVGFIRNCGILRREHIDRLNEAYRLYRSRRPDSNPREIEATLFRRSYSHETRIRFIGVWDTVGSLGIPLDGLRLVNLFNRRWQFHDTELSGIVDSAFHALAIDEKRGPFRPTLWGPRADAPTDQRIEQVWFTGVHSDVGGGYPEHELSDIALLWMVDRARSCGLAFDHDAFLCLPSRDAQAPPGATSVTARTAVYPDPLGPLHESRTGVYRLIKPFVRPLGTTDASHEYVASSAGERRAHLPTSAPANLVAYLDNTPQTIEVEEICR
ncbi:hypothetical protein MB901379_02724 [Mycobacterium basiliense]|uniref:T6SS Phospholipase effector Tle1-like catalytic domain-containing protein n=1 Tax=Mycobacterium basiliense TaxID=2094119 RepID=A0A3S4BF07_9MYCO|nr:DUF2235 domain-containing protein [Mycobacterium basiliense]VDM89156.1 hypothetical protein MB901379_02724 [Mycobacterium basiliense]